VHLGLQQQQQALDGSVAEHHDIVDRLKCGDDFGPLARWYDRSPRTFQRGDRSIVVDGNDEAIGLSRGTAQVSNVSDVQEIEASVGESDSPTLSSVAGDHLDQLIF
jgi:hypothetical protein